MPITQAMVVSSEELKAEHIEHEGFEYVKKLVMPREGNQCTVALMEIPPGKAAYPYHYHAGVTEVFFILEGTGELRTPDGLRTVTQGDFIVCPPGPVGAHLLRNPSEAPLRYVDFDTTSGVDAPFYPDSGKVSIIVNGEFTGPFRLSSEVDYYDGE